MVRCAGLLWVAFAAGCGLVDSSIADINLTLPAQNVAVDTADWNLSDDDSLPSIDCSQDETLCAQSSDSFCDSAAPGECASTCDEATSTCELNLGFSIVQTLDLGSETPELESLDGKPLVSVTIRKVSYTVTENTLNTDLPAIGIYLAPSDVTSSDNGAATVIGTIGPIAAGATAPGEMTLSEDGQALLTSYIKSYSTPFNLLADTRMNIGAGESMPTGKLDLRVVVTATAGL